MKEVIKIMVKMCSINYPSFSFRKPDSRLDRLFVENAPIYCYQNTNKAFPSNLQCVIKSL